MPNSTFGLGPIRQVSVNVADLPRAEAFYRDKLGMRHLFTVPNMAFFDADGVRLMLALPEDGDTPQPCSVIYFLVPDILAAHAELSGRGVEFVQGPHLVARLPQQEIWMAFFRDSEGNLMSLTSEVPVSQPVSS